MCRWLANIPTEDRDPLIRLQPANAIRKHAACSFQFRLERDATAGYRNTMQTGLPVWTTSPVAVSLPVA